MAALHDVVVQRPAVSELEVVAKPTRRRFRAEYKRRILREADACTEPGAIGALLRREGLYSSHLRRWPAQRARGALAGLTPKQRGPAVTPRSPLAAKVAGLEREVTRYKVRAERAEALVELQKKWPSSWGRPGRSPTGSPDGARQGTLHYPGRAPALPGVGRPAGQLLPLAPAQAGGSGDPPPGPADLATGEAAHLQPALAAAAHGLAPAHDGAGRAAEPPGHPVQRETDLEQRQGLSAPCFEYRGRASGSHRGCAPGETIGTASIVALFTQESINGPRMLRRSSSGVNGCGGQLPAD